MTGSKEYKACSKKYAGVWIKNKLSHSYRGKYLVCFPKCLLSIFAKFVPCQSVL